MTVTVGGGDPTEDLTRSVSSAQGAASRLIGP